MQIVPSRCCCCAESLLLLCRSSGVGGAGPHLRLSVALLALGVRLTHLRHNNNMNSAQQQALVAHQRGGGYSPRIYRGLRFRVGGQEVILVLGVSGSAQVSVVSASRGTRHTRLQNRIELYSSTPAAGQCMAAAPHTLRDHDSTRKFCASLSTRYFIHHTSLRT